MPFDAIVTGPRSGRRLAGLAWWPRPGVPRRSCRRAALVPCRPPVAKGCWMDGQATPRAMPRAMPGQADLTATSFAGHPVIKRLAPTILSQVATGFWEQAAV